MREGCRKDDGRMAEGWRKVGRGRQRGTNAWVDKGCVPRTHPSTLGGGMRPDLHKGVPFLASLGNFPGPSGQRGTISGAGGLGSLIREDLGGVFCIS